MGRRSCCKDQGLKRGAWSAEEDRVLVEYIKAHGGGRWGSLPGKAGLNRCGKSCRLRWLNYLRPDIKRGNISPDEEELIIRLHKLLGNRWSLIAGRLPGRTDNEIKNYWKTILCKRARTSDQNWKLKAPELHRPRDETNPKAEESNNAAENNDNAIQPPLPQERNNTAENNENAIQPQLSLEKEPPASMAFVWAATLKCSEVDINPQLSIRQDEPFVGAISMKSENVEPEYNNNATIGLLSNDDMAGNLDMDLGFDFGDVSLSDLLGFGLSSGNNSSLIPSINHRDDDMAPGHVIQPLSSLFTFDSPEG